MKSVRNKVVVITGASSGFGRGAALEFARHGANLVLAARRSGLLNKLCAECERRGVRAVAVVADVSRRENVERIASQAVAHFGHFDVWINNAGVATYGEFDRVPIAEHEQVVRTNLFGTISGSYVAMRHFRQQGRGVLINMASYLGKGSAPYHSSYVASKHGIRGLGMALRQDLEALGNNRIHVCTVMPTSHDTPFFGHAGNHTGKPVRPTPPVYDPQQVIDALVELTVNPQEEVMVGSSAKVASVAGKLMPTVVEKRMAKKVYKEHMGQKESAPHTEGSIFKPMDSGEEVRGGWLRRKRVIKKVGAAAAIAAPVAFGLGVLFGRQREEGGRVLPRRTHRVVAERIHEPGHDLSA